MGELGSGQKATTKESLQTKAVGEQKQCPENVLTVWQHFVARIKDFKSSLPCSVGDIDPTELITGLG